MLREIRNLISNSDTTGLEKNPYHLHTLLELTENSSLVCPEAAGLLYPLVGNYCIERMSALLQRIQMLDGTIDGEDNVQKLVENGDLYWNHIKGLCLGFKTKQE